jgi:hypothetical protein
MIARLTGEDVVRALAQLDAQHRQLVLRFVQRGTLLRLIAGASKDAFAEFEREMNPEWAYNLREDACADCGGADLTMHRRMLFAIIQEAQSKRER